MSLDSCSLQLVAFSQFDRKPSPDYMEKLQQDITQGMRGILIDWLVEVSLLNVISSVFLIPTVFRLTSFAFSGSSFIRICLALPMQECPIIDLESSVFVSAFFFFI